MGNTIMKWVPIFGQYDANQYDYDMTANEKDEKLQAKDDQVLRDCKDVDLVNLINFLDKQGVDVKSLKHMIADILQKHQTTQFHPVFQALQTALKSQGQFDDMIKAINALVNENKIAIIKRTQSNHGSQQKEFYANVEAMSNLVTNVLSAAGAGPVGPILVCLLQSIKKVNFFTSACRTEGHKDETLGIIDIVWDDERNGTVLFEIAKVEVKMVDQQGEVVFVGSSKVMVNIDMYYARASMELQDFMTPEQLKKLKANTKGNCIL